MKAQADPSPLIDYPILPYDAQVKVTLVARPLPMLVAGKLYSSGWTWYANEQNVGVLFYLVLPC
jgi:hypothetical protein